MALTVPEVKVEDKSALTVEIKPETPAMVKPDTSKLRGTALSNADTIPSNWDIKASEDGLTATNNITGRTFTGSSEEFSAMLRGE
jgi:hypothetical protein